MEENSRIIENIKYTLKIENCNLEQEDITLMKSFLNDEITKMQAIEKIKSEFLY